MARPTGESLRNTSSTAWAVCQVGRKAGERPSPFEAFSCCLGRLLGGGNPPGAGPTWSRHPLFSRPVYLSEDRTLH